MVCCIQQSRNVGYMNFSERFFAHYRALFLIFAIFFIYLLIIYPACPARGKKSDDSTCTSHRFFFLSAEDASRAERSRVSEILRLLQRALPPDTFSFACQKRTRKAPATFEAREARTRGCSPLVTPMLLGSIQKIQVAPLKDFLCCADFKAPQSLRDSSPQGSERQQMQLLATAPSREKANQEDPQIFLICNIKNNFSADDGAAHAEPF